MFMSLNWTFVRILKLDNCTKLCPLSIECLVTFDCSDLPLFSLSLDVNLLAVLPIFYYYIVNCPSQASTKTYIGKTAKECLPN